LLAIWADADCHVRAQIAFGSTNVNHMTLGAIQDLPVPSWQYRRKWLVGDFDEVPSGMWLELARRNLRDIEVI